MSESRGAVHLTNLVRIAGPVAVATTVALASGRSVFGDAPAFGLATLFLFVLARLAALLLRDRPGSRSTGGGFRGLWAYLGPAAVVLLVIGSLVTANVPAALVLTVAGGTIAAQLIAGGGDSLAATIVRRAFPDAAVDGACGPLLVWTALQTPLPASVIPILLISVLDALSLGFLAGDVLHPTREPAAGRSGTASSPPVMNDDAPIRRGRVRRTSALLASAGLTASVGIGVACGIPRPTFELALTAAAIPAMVLVFAWLALLDPDPEMGRHRVSLLLIPAIAVHFLGLALVAMA